MTQTQILSRLRELLSDTFEIDPARVTPEADLYKDQEMTGKRIKPDEFRSVRTVGDVITAVDRLLAA